MLDNIQNSVPINFFLIEITREKNQKGLDIAKEIRSRDPNATT